MVSAEISQYEREAIELVSKNPLDLKFIDNLEEASYIRICLVAVRKYGYVLKFALVQTREMCLIAVKQDGFALQFVWNKLLEICVAALKQCGLALKWIDRQSIRLCLMAVKQNGIALQFSQYRTRAICRAAVIQNGYAMWYIPEQDIELINVALSNVFFFGELGFFTLYDRRRLDLIHDPAIKALY